MFNFKFFVCRNLPFILLTRPLDIEGFPSNAPILAKYLTALITGNTNEHLEIDKLVSSIKAWKDAELEMLCEMSMDSMCQLFSEFQKYDSRWNEVFMLPPTEDLIQLKVVMVYPFEIKVHCFFFLKKSSIKFCKDFISQKWPKIWKIGKIHEI